MEIITVWNFYNWQYICEQYYKETLFIDLSEKASTVKVLIFPHLCMVVGNNKTALSLILYKRHLNFIFHPGCKCQGLLSILFSLLNWVCSSARWLLFVYSLGLPIEYGFKSYQSSFKHLSSSNNLRNKRHIKNESYLIWTIISSYYYYLLSRFVLLFELT